MLSRKETLEEIEEFKAPVRSKEFILSMAGFTAALTSGFALIYMIIADEISTLLLLTAGVTFTGSLVVLALLLTNVDLVRARQTNELLRLARQIFACMHEGLNKRSAQKICELLMSASDARGVVIAGKEELLGYAGFQKFDFRGGYNQALSRIVAAPTWMDGQTHILHSPADVDLSINPATVQSVIVVPLRVGRRIIATLQFYYRRRRQITATQTSMAEGFSQLLSTQLAAGELEQQTQLATSMQLKALQNQINPHFLFNTINTIAALIRSDPMRARTLLREFATFYRQTLENDGELIMLSREIQQTVRYFGFEEARFGAERVGLELEEEEGIDDFLVPPFLIQPLVENAVKHAMPAEGKLIIKIAARREEGYLVISVIDNGIGMDEATCANIMHPESSTGAGIAVKNVRDRIKGYFGPESHMEVVSAPGQGTTVSIRLYLGADGGATAGGAR